MAKKTAQELTIKPANFGVISFLIEGTSPYMQLRFSQKQKGAMIAKMEAGSTAKTKRTREARDFDEDFKQAQYISDDGWNGIPASAFRKAMISACRIVGFQMTKAKLAIFALHQGLDKYEGTPLVRLISDFPPEQSTMAVRNATGVIDLRCRPMWRIWSAAVSIRFDADMFTADDILNLMNRAGQQVGIGEGRADSKASAGIDMGFFQVKSILK